MATVKVYHNRMYVPSYEQQSNRPFELVAIVTTEKLLGCLEDAFALTQHFDGGSWDENENVQLVSKSRSSSVGDVFVVATANRSHYFEVAGEGWRRVTDLRLKLFQLLTETDGDKPLFTHDCDDCIYLGHTIYTDTARRAMRYDLYYCVKGNGSIPTVLARWSSKPSEYLSGMPNSPIYEWPGYPLDVAKERAESRRLRIA